MQSCGSCGSFFIGLIISVPHFTKCLQQLTKPGENIPSYLVREIVKLTGSTLPEIILSQLTLSQNWAQTSVCVDLQWLHLHQVQALS